MSYIHDIEQLPQHRYTRWALESSTHSWRGRYLVLIWTNIFIVKAVDNSKPAHSFFLIPCALHRVIQDRAGQQHHMQHLRSKGFTQCHHFKASVGLRPRPIRDLPIISHHKRLRPSYNLCTNLLDDQFSKLTLTIVLLLNYTLFFSS